MGKCIGQFHGLVETVSRVDGSGEGSREDGESVRAFSTTNSTRKTNLVYDKSDE